MNNRHRSSDAHGVATKPRGIALSENTPEHPENDSSAEELPYTNDTRWNAQKRNILNCRSQGMPWDEIATTLNIGRSTLYRWRAGDDDFADECEKAGEAGIRIIEDAVIAGAAKVVDDPRYTTLAIFTLKNRAGGRWRDVQDHRFSGGLDMRGIDQEELERMAHAAGMESAAPDAPEGHTDGD